MRSTVEALLPLHSLQPPAFKNHDLCGKLSIFQIVDVFLMANYAHISDKDITSVLTALGL